MPLDFPLTSANNQVYTVDNRTYVFDGNAWNLSFGPLTALNSISVIDNDGDGSGQIYIYIYIYISPFNRIIV